MLIDSKVADPAKVAAIAARELAAVAITESLAADAAEVEAMRANEQAQRVAGEKRERKRVLVEASVLADAVLADLVIKA